MPDDFLKLLFRNSLITQPIFGACSVLLNWPEKLSGQILFALVKQRLSYDIEKFDRTTTKY